MRIKYKKFSNGKYFWMMIARKMSHFLAFNLVQYFKKKRLDKKRQDFVPEYHKSLRRQHPVSKICIPLMHALLP